jgi:hypothetical protein
MVDNILVIKFFNVVDLIPGRKVEEVSVLDRTRLLKTVLMTIDKQFSTPDQILIEYQMGPNDIARMISSQIAYHYTEVTNIEFKCKVSKSIIDTNCITYAVKHFPLNAIDFNPSSNSIHLISPMLKNAYHIATDGAYENFIVKSSNTVANKKHTLYNFSHYIKIMMANGNELLDNIPNKANDISDSFMQLFGYLKKKALL